ncbi:protein TASOR isoform 2-T2 [Odontesthes bonariensis]|uniref:protein TASOR isoform X2 n=1 Tax=Odontesthes bonariensis TaxID=219752 RepID=UPI003F585052
MDDSLFRREACRPRRASATADLGANVSLHDGQMVEVHPARETHPIAGILTFVGGRMERSNSVSQGFHQRHMPMEPNKFHIPRKTKEKKALFQYVSFESREYEDMKTILTSSYIDTSSASCFTYSKPRLVHSELLEKEFVEKRKEMKAEGRTDKELEESYCFLLTNTVELPFFCEKGLALGHSRITVLGDPNKGVYLSRYSDLLQLNLFTPGTTGEIIIFKVMKGKVKSIYENMKNLLDPTPRFDSHIAKNASKVTSLTCYHAFELTQQYFYEYSFDELRQRPRQVCPYAVISFQIKGKDTQLPSKPLAPIRLNSQSSERSKAGAQFTVWMGDLVKDKRVLFQISLRSSSSPFLPHRLPEKLEIGDLMRLDQVTKLLPSGVFSYNIYKGSQEVVTDGHHCSLMEVIDRNRSTTSVTTLLQELEIKRVVLVTSLSERGFLLLLSSVQMATPTERGETWQRCLQALFVFPETRDVAQCTSLCTSSYESLTASASVMPRLSEFLPALHHALVKARANPPPKLSLGVELQTREYLTGLKDGNVRQYPMSEYDSKLDEEAQLFSPPKHHRVNMDSYLHSYLSSPTLYLLSVARAKEVVKAHCGSGQPPEMRARNSSGSQREAPVNDKDKQTSDQKIQQLLDLILTCKRNAENEMGREEEEVLKAPERKRKIEQETAERALKYFKASQGHKRHEKIPVEVNKVPSKQSPSSAPVSLASVMGSLGLKDLDLRDDGSELAATLIGQLTGLIQTANQSFCEAKEERLRESSPFGKLATKLGLPTNCDIDLRKQEELEEQTAGSISSLEGFSPGSQSGDTNQHGAAGRRGGGLRKKVETNEEPEEEWEIPWVLIPITGLCSERYSQRDRNLPQDPRFQHLAMATSISATTKPSRKSPTLSPEPSPLPSPYQCPSPDASPPPSQCPSPDPSPPPSPSHCPSPEPSPPPSPSQCPSPEASPATSPSQCPFPLLSPATFPAQRSLPETSPLLSLSQWRSLEFKELKPLHKNHRSANEQQLVPPALMELPGLSNEKEMKNEEPVVSTPTHPSNPPAPEQRIKPSSPPIEGVKEAEGAMGEVEEVKDKRLEEGKESQPEVQKYWEEEADECKQIEREAEDLIIDISSESDQREEENEPERRSLSSPSVTSTACPHRNIDSIVDKHLGDFSSEIQRLLQAESVHYSLPEPTNSTSNTEAPTPQHTLPYTPVSQFSQYVSFYNPCPPVQNYVSSLQDSINRMLTVFNDSCPSHRADTGRTHADATLANTVSDFVASVRAANGGTGREDEVSALRVEQTTATLSVSKGSTLSRGDEVWLSDTKNWRSSPTSRVTLTDSASGSLYKPANSLEVCRTVTQNIGSTQDGSTERTVGCSADVEDEGERSSANCTVSMPVAEDSHSSVSVPEPTTSPAPSAKDLNSVINRLEPDVLNNLVEIMKDIKRKSPHFYIHCTEPGDQVYEEVKEHLLKLGNVQQSPVDFLNKGNSENGLLVIIKNKDIARHIHKIPGLMALKRQSSVVFVGIDSLDDIKNNSCIELFVSGGCIVSDELVLNPDIITHDRLAALLMLLEQHSSPESVWRWKIHCRTHKKLKEQARFRRDAANLLEVLSVYQKRQIIDFLPYHHCDMMNHQSPDLDCLIEHQARYTQFRHTVLLTEHHFEKFPAYSNEGIIVVGIEEILDNFIRLIGCHNIKDKQVFVEDLLVPKGPGKQSNHGDSVSVSEFSSSAFPEHIQPISSCHQPQRILPQPGSNLPSLPRVSDQLVPDTLSTDGLPLTSSRDMEFLQQAIRQLRAERQEQLQQLKQQQHCLEIQEEPGISPLNSLILNPVGTGSVHKTPPFGQGVPSELAQPTPTRKAVATTLESIHSVLQSELWDEKRRKDRQQHPTEGRRSGSLEGGEPGDQRESTPVRMVSLRTGNLAPGNTDTSAVMGLSHQTEPANGDREEKADQQRESEISLAAKCGAFTVCSVENNKQSETRPGQEELKGAEVAPPSSSAASGTKVTGTRISVITGREGSPNPAPNQQHIQQQHQQQHQQQLRKQQLLSEQLTLSQPPPYRQQPPRGAGLLQNPHLTRFHAQPFLQGPMLGPLTPIQGIRGLLGPSHLCPGGLGPTGAPLVWSFQQTGVDFLGGYYSPAGPGSNMYRGGRRGGGFNGM